ncbi:MAG: phosphate signaling complex protein PhoU [Erysipelothrix sp.]|nr:phosphate signaling complex protein PhoU [Erysipelothrix sp.]
MRLEEKLHAYDELILLMAERVRQMFTLSREALNTSDKEKALVIVEMDDYVNHFDEDINLRATEMLSLFQPVAKDLRAIIAGIKIATDLERIGDYAKSIARFIVRNDKLDESTLKSCNELFEIAITQYDLMLQALRTNDLKLAFQVPEEDEKLDAGFIRIVMEIEESIQTRELEWKIPLKIASLLRNLERSGDHTKNICESIIYKVKGQHIDFG